MPIAGPETDPITAFTAVEEFSKVDGSVGWRSWVTSAVSMYTAWIPASLGRKLFGQPLDVRAAFQLRVRRPSPNGPTPQSLRLVSGA